MDTLISKSATEIVELLKQGEITPVDTLEAVRKRLDEVDGAVNAAPLRYLDEAERVLEDSSKVGKLKDTLLAGIPVLIKDNNDLRGAPTTSGSPLNTALAESNDSMVEGVMSSGGLPYGKSNMPEFAGANSVNPVYGATRNPRDLSLSVGGSSGGAAAALASGTAWLATGNDLGGSLRTPAGFCGVYSLRPTPGMIPRGRPFLPYDHLMVEGPMARSLDDVRLFFSAMAGYDRRDPVSRPHSARDALTPNQKWAGKLRIAYSPDLGDLPVEKTVRQVTRRAADRLGQAGHVISEVNPGIEAADRCFRVKRSFLLRSALSDLIDNHADEINRDVLEDARAAESLSPRELWEADKAQGALIAKMDDFFDRYDLLVCPAAPLQPFDVTTNWPSTIDGRELTTYIDWIAITYRITVLGCPVITVPCGVDAAGLPVGLQIVGPRFSDFSLIDVAARLIEALPEHSSGPVDLV